MFTLCELLDRYINSDVCCSCSIYIKMAVYLVFFVMGFITDKIRLFPFVLGVLLGIVLKTMVENVSVQSIPIVGKNIYNRAMDMYKHHTTSENVT